MNLIRNGLLFLIAFLPLASWAQSNQGKLVSTLTDSTGKPVVYATISLFKEKNLKEPLKTTYSDKTGGFNLTADTGLYVLSITHVSLGEARINIAIKNGENIVDTIRLSSLPKLMQNITITVRKPLIEQGDDRITYNVESDPAAKSESATDLLRKTPMLTVDGDGNVQLNGQSNFKILLNGRETSMFAQNVKDALKNFPGAVISKIESLPRPLPNGMPKALAASSISSQRKR